MQDFLLDGNHVTAMYHKNTHIAANVRSIPPERKLIVTETIRAELEAGHEMNPAADQTKIAEFWHWLDNSLFRLEPSEDTSRKYAKIIGLLHRTDPKVASDKDNQGWLQRIGVQINDVWFVAECWSHNAICVTHDKMAKIKVAVGNNVRFEDWLP